MKISKRKINGLILLSSILFSVNKLSAQCAVPNPVTATPSLFCAPGGTTNLNATSLGNSINWYTVPTGGTPIGSSGSGVNFVATAVTTTTFYAESFSIAQVTLNYTGAMQTYTVPGGVFTMTVDVRGAKGGTSTNIPVGPGGNGGRVTGTIAVTPGQVLQIYVGQRGGNGTTFVPGAGGFNGGGTAGISVGAYSGGGGGGASDIRVAPYALANRIVVVGGGGGGAYNYGTPGYDRGGMGGGLSGEGGYSGNILLGNGPAPGGGGTQVSGGTNGMWPGYCWSFVGVFGIGGQGASPCGNTGGGGGGGWYGGGGGCWGGGGGGSSYLVNGTHTQGFQVGDGQVILTGAGCTSASRGAVVVTVAPSPTVTITGPTQICIGSTLNLTANGATSYSWSTGATTQTISGTPTVNTTYTVLGTDIVSGCSSTATRVVAVNALPLISISGANTLCAGSPLTLTGLGGNTFTWSPGGVVNPMVSSPTVNTTYSVVGTNTTTGCSNSAVTSVTVNAVPNVTVTGPYAMCMGQTITLNAYGAPTYSWSTGVVSPSVAVSPTANISYTVIGTSPLGCGSSAVVKSVTVNPTPTVTITVPSTLICIGESIILTAGGVDTYSWNTGAISTTISSSPTVNVTYTVTGTNTLTGCYNTTTISIYASPCTGLSKNSSADSELRIYPNPNTGEFTVELNNGLHKTIEVYDLTGRVISTNKSDENKVHLNINNLSNGIYYVKIYSDNAIEVVKIVKQ